MKWKNNLISQQEIAARQYAAVEPLWGSCRKCSPLLTMGMEVGFLPQSRFLLCWAEHLTLAVYFCSKITIWITGTRKMNVDFSTMRFVSVGHTPIYVQVSAAGSKLFNWYFSPPLPFPLVPRRSAPDAWIFSSGSEQQGAREANVIFHSLCQITTDLYELGPSVWRFGEELIYHNEVMWRMMEFGEGERGALLQKVID